MRSTQNAFELNLANRNLFSHRYSVKKRPQHGISSNAPDKKDSHRENKGSGERNKDIDNLLIINKDKQEAHKAYE